MTVTPGIILPSPHPGQMWVRQNARRFNWLVAGRRWRKTTNGICIAVEKALQGYPVFWGAPVYDQVRIAWDELKKAAGRVASFSQSSMTCQFPHAGKIIFRSLDDPDNARGHTAALALLDEFPKIRPEAYYEVVRPMLMDTNGEL